MKLAVIGPLIVILCVGCAITSDEAVVIATREIAKRERPLPKHYRTTTELVPITPEEDRTTEEWYVVFTTADGKKELYRVSVNKYNHTVRDVFEPSAAER
jgi:hypothetical protein